MDISDQVDNLKVEQIKNFLISYLGTGPQRVGLNKTLGISRMITKIYHI